MQNLQLRVRALGKSPALRSSAVYTLQPESRGAAARLPHAPPAHVECVRVQRRRPTRAYVSLLMDGYWQAVTAGYCAEGRSESGGGGADIRDTNNACLARVPTLLADVGVKRAYIVRYAERWATPAQVAASTRAAS